MTKASTKLHMAPRGWSFHGQELRNDTLGARCRPSEVPTYTFICPVCQTVTHRESQIAPFCCNDWQTIPYRRPDHA